MRPDSEVIKSLSVEFHLIVSAEDEFLSHLANAVNDLIHNDFLALVQILYRRDISESKLKKTLQKYTDQDAGLIIGQLLIERETQKNRSREQFKRDDTAGEKERW